MAKSRMILQITVTCGCGGLNNLLTYYGGGARDEQPGSVVGFLRFMAAAGWRELDDEQWLCPECVAKRTPQKRIPLAAGAG